MSDLFWPTDAQMARLEPYFPKPHGKPRVDDSRVLNEIIFINRNGLRWRDAPKEYSPHKTLYNRWKRWSDKGIFRQMMAGLAAQHGEKKTVMIDATYLKAHRNASSLGAEKRGRGSLIGRTKGGMNTKLHAICECKGRPINFFVSAGQVSDYIGARALLSSLPDVDWLLGTVATTPIGSGKRCMIRAYAPASPAGNSGKLRQNMTSAATNAATASRSCSAGSRIGNVSQPDTTGDPTPSSPPSLSPPSSSIGYESEA